MPCLTNNFTSYMTSNAISHKRWMLEHNEHDKTKKESLHLDLPVNGKLQRKTGTTVVLNRKIAFYGKCPCSTRVYTIEMSSDANAPKRWTEVHMMLNISSFGRTFIRATVLPQLTLQNSTQQQITQDLVKIHRSGKKKGFGPHPGPKPI